MKTNRPNSLLRASAIAASLFFLPLLVSAGETEANDTLARKLAQAGLLQLSSVGPYVESGTYRVQVAAKLGAPTWALPDGTWLYQGFRIDDSEARGTLVVRFDRGRVKSLSLATPQTVAALRAAPGQSNRSLFVTSETRR